MYGHFQPAQRMATPMSSQPTRSLFVGDLSFFCTEVDLVEAFSCFGEILNCEIKRSRGGDSLMHGFVDFAREADACRAIQHMNGRKFMGRKLKVNWTNQKSSDFERESWVQVHVNFLCPNINAKITEEVLETIFVRFGNFADISVKRHLCSYQPHQTTGYAFVYFFDAHTALRAIYGLRSGPVNGIHFECCLSHKAEQMLREVQGMGAVIKRQQTGNPGAFFKKFEGKQQHHMPRRFQPAPVHQQFPSSSAHRSISPSFLQSQSHFDALPQSELFASTEFVSRSGSASPKSFSSADSLSTPTLSSESHLFDFARFQPERPSHLPSYTSSRPAHSQLEFLSFLEDPQQFSIDLF